MKFDIKSRLDNAVIFTAELDARFENEPGSVQLGAAVKEAVKAKTDLRGADLQGADLGEGVKAARLIARVTRLIDHYEFFAWRVEDGRCLIYAGCRQGWTVEQFVSHTAGYTDAAKRDETLAILEFIGGRDRADAAKCSIDSKRKGDK